MDKGRLSGMAVTPGPCSQVPSYAAPATRLGEGSTCQWAELQGASGWESSLTGQGHRVTKYPGGEALCFLTHRCLSSPSFHLLSSRCAGGWGDRDGAPRKVKAQPALGAYNSLGATGQRSRS